MALISAIFERAGGRSQCIGNRLRISFTVSTDPKATVIVVDGNPRKSIVVDGNPRKSVGAPNGKT